MSGRWSARGSAIALPQTHGSPEEVERVLAPVELQSEVGGRLERATGDGRVVGRHDEMGSESLRTPSACELVERQRLCDRSYLTMLA